MSTEDQQPGDDLVDRWLAHRARTAEDPATRPRTYGIARTQPSGRTAAQTPAAPPVPAAPPRSADASVEDVPVDVVAAEEDDVADQAESTPEPTPEPTPVAAAAASEVGIDLEGFEPVLTASARRALEQTEQRRGRARRGRRRDDEPVSGPGAGPEPDVADADPDPDTDAQEESAPAPPDHVGVGRDVLALLGTATPAPTTDPTPMPESEPEAEPEAVPVPTPERAPEPLTEPPAPAPVRISAPAAPPPPAAALPTELHSPGGVRAATGVLLLLALAATSVTGYVAYQDPTETALGLAGVLALLTAVIWAVRASTSPTRMSLQQGRLEIHSAAGRHLFDLANPHTSIEVRGRPGSRGWKVLFHRRTMAPFVVDSSMVDPTAFTEVLLHHRPDLRATTEAVEQRS